MTVSTLVLAMISQALLATSPILTPLEGDALLETFRGHQFRGYEAMPSPPPESFRPDGRFVVYSRVRIEGTYWVDGAGLCVRTPLHDRPECRYFARDLSGRVFQTGRDRDGVRIDFEAPQAIVLAPLKDEGR